MKRLKILFLMVIAMMTAGAYAHDFTAVNNDGKTIYYKILSSEEKTCSVVYAGDNIYINPYKYTGTVNIPAEVEYEGETYRVTQIGPCAFWDCQELTCVNMPEGITYLDMRAFAGSEALTSITLPSTVDSLGWEAFCECIGLTSITSLNPVAPSLEMSVFCDVDSTIAIYVPEGSTASYAAAWSEYFSNFIEMTDAGIEDAENADNSVSVMGQQVSIKGAAGQMLRVFDVQGRCIQAVRASSDNETVNIPQSGVYFIQAGSSKAQKVIIAE